MVSFFRSQRVTLFLPSTVEGPLFVFSTTALLFNDSLILAFVTNFGGVYRRFRNEFGIKTCESSAVLCKGAMIAFLPGSASSSLLEESVSGFRLAQLCLMHEAQEKLASESTSRR